MSRGLPRPAAGRSSGTRGAGTTIDTVLEDPRLTGLVPLVRPPFLGVADPRLKVLEQAGADARAIRIELTDPDQAEGP